MSASSARESADDELIIRHVRLCDCGLPAGHDRVCRPSRFVAGLDPERDVERVPADWEDTLTHRQQRHWGKLQSDLREERIVWLRALTLRELVDRALAPQTSSTVPGGNLEPSRGGSERAGPPRQQLSDDDPRVRLAQSQMRRAAEQLIRLHWEEHGWESSVTATTMLGEHKDAEILRCVPAKPREVVQLLGSQTAGGSRTVERVREAAGCCRWCGQAWSS